MSENTKKKLCILAAAICIGITGLLVSPTNTKVMAADNANLNLKLAFSSDTIQNAQAQPDETNITHDINYAKDIKIKYILDIELSGADFQTDEVRVELPAHIAKYRENDGFSDDGLLKFQSIGITNDKATAANSVIPFYYEYNTDKSKLLIKNARALLEGGTYKIEVEYLVKTPRIVDMTKALIQAQGFLQEVETTPSNTLTYEFNTMAAFDTLHVSSALMHSWTSSSETYSSSKKPLMDTNNYRYVAYKTRVTPLKDTTGYMMSQPYELNIDLDLDNNGSIFYVGYGTSSYVYDVDRNHTVDKVNNKISLRTNGTNVASTYLTAAASPTYYIIVAYPREVGTTSYSTTIKGELKPTDAKDLSTAKEEVENVAWSDYLFNYPDANLSITSQMLVPTNIGMTLLDNEIDYTMPIQSTKVIGKYYPDISNPATANDSSKYYGATIVNDLKYLADNTKTNPDQLKSLSTDDVYIKEVNFYFTNAVTNRNSGEVTRLDVNTAYGEKEVDFYFKVGTDSAWGNKQSIKFKDFIKNTAVVPSNYKVAIVPPANAVQIKVELPPIFQDLIEAELHVTNVLKKESPRYAELRDMTKDGQTMKYYGFVGAMAKDGEGNNVKEIQESSYNQKLKDLGLLTYDQNNYSGLIARTNDTSISLEIIYVSKLSRINIFQGKESDNISDSTNQTMYHPFTMNFFQSYSRGYNDSSMKDVAIYNELVAKGLPPVSMDKAAFYILLPRGTSLVNSDLLTPKVKRTDSGLANVDVEIVSNNYKGTHCQLVKLNVSSNLPDGENTSHSWNVVSNNQGQGSAFEGRGSLYTVKFYVSVPYSETGNVNNTRILTAAQIDGDIVGTGYADTGGQLGNNDIKLEDGSSVFYNLAQKEQVDINLLNTDYVTINLDAHSGASAYSHGLKSFVRPSDLNSVSSFASKSTVIPKQEYEYRLLLNNGQKSDLQNVILFNNFGQGTSPGIKTWSGIFKSVDLNALEQKGIKPIVYYTTQENARYFSITDPIPAEWSTVRPADAREIKGVAIDVSKKKDNAPLILKEKDAISVYITMTAPDEMPADGAVTELNYASYSGKIGNTPILPENVGVYTPNTETTLIRPALTKSTSTSDMLKINDEITYTLTYENQTDFEQNIVLSDEAPLQTAFKEQLGTNTADPTVKVDNNVFTDEELARTVTVNKTKKSIVWNFNVPPHSVAEVTFKVVVQESMKGVILNKADAKIGDYTFSSNEVRNQIEPTLVKSVDKESTYKDKVLKYHISYTNEYDTPQKVVIEDKLPISTRFATSKNNAELGLPTAKLNQTEVAKNWTIVGDKIIWTFDNVPSNSTVDVTFQVETEDIGIVENSAFMFLNDSTLAYESNKTSTKVDKVPLLQKAYKNITSSKVHAVVGDIIRYECVFKNENDTNKHIIIKDAAPVGTILFDNGTGAKGNPKATLNGEELSSNATIKGQEINWIFKEVKPDDEIKVTFEVVVQKDGADKIDNIAYLLTDGESNVFSSNLVSFNKIIADKPDTPGETDKPDTPGGTDKPDTPGETDKPDTPGGTDKPDTPGGTDKPIPPVRPDTTAVETSDAMQGSSYFMLLGISLAAILCIILNKKKTNFEKK